MRRIAKLFCERHNISPESIIEKDKNVNVLIPFGVNPENPLVVCTAKDVNDLISAVVQALDKACPETDMALMKASGDFPYEVRVHINNILCQKSGSDYDIDKARCVLVKIADIPAFQAAMSRRGVIFSGGALTEDGQAQYFYK